MCAISGIINFHKPVLKEELQAISNRMYLRGPDESNVFIDNNIGLAHRRLSVIDLETGQQPMKICDDTIIIVFNGEIYNFRELKAQLLKKGFTFKTQSDTEVVAVAYKAYGIDKCLQLLEGMFAFALYDKQQNLVYIARDRFGEKPLYYARNSDSFIFASELKAFAPDLSKYAIDKKALNYFLALSYIPAPYTIYEGISKLCPGTYITISDDKNIEFTQFYQLSSVFTQQTELSFETAKKELYSRLTESVKKRMVADVPMGAFLSGGIDSSIICSIMSKLSDTPINTFSIGFKEKDYDESERARIVAKAIGANHTEYILDYKDVLDVLDDIILYYDEPFGDSSAIPSYYVAKLAREKVKVVLTGDCADELFGGYEKYLGQYYVERYRRTPSVLRVLFEKTIEVIPQHPRINVFLRKAKKVIRNTKCTEFDLYYNLMCLGFEDESRKKLLIEGCYQDVKQEIYSQFQRGDKLSYLQKEQYCDIKYVLEGDMFPKVDRACMHTSLENRAPFIDSEIVNLALNLPDYFKIQGNNKKYILKETFKDLLPPNTLHFSKKGFSVPIDYWFRNELKEELSTLLNETFIRQQGLFNYEYVSKLLDAHLNNKENNKGQLWNLFVFQKWYISKINL